jgi:hypothetical protein
VRCLADENFNGDILRTVRHRRPEIDIVRVQDVGLSGAPDPQILEWAAREERVVITHDVSTLAGFAYERIVGSLPMPGVMIVSDNLGIGAARGYRTHRPRGRRHRRTRLNRSGAFPAALGATACSGWSDPRA